MKRFRAEEVIAAFLLGFVLGWVLVNAIDMHRIRKQIEAEVHATK